MKKLKIKISLYENKRIVIENYQKLKELSKTIIEIDNYCLKGKDLQIKQMDDMFIEIIGIVSEIIVGDFDV